MFEVADYTHRLYRRRHSRHVIGLPAGRFVPEVRPPSGPPDEILVRRQRPEVLYRELLRVLAPPSLVLDEHNAVAEVFGDVSPWCAVAEGTHTGAVVDLLRQPYRLPVHAMLAQLRHSSPDTVVREIRANGEDVVVTVKRLTSDRFSSVVSFRRLSESSVALPVSEGTPDSEVVRVTAELESTQLALQATVEDLSAANEELQAINEELQASSEELQASSEEMQASNEELEAANEELTTVNQELQSRGAELVRANTDLENIQGSLTSGLVLVDRQLRVSRFTPLAVRLFSLIPADVGRPLPAVPTTIPVPQLTGTLNSTIAANQSQIIELSDGTRDLLLQTQPYLGSASEVLGAIVVVIDVSEIAAMKRERERALENLESVTESIRELVWQRDLSGSLNLLTSRVEDLYGLDRQQVLADPSLLRTAIHPDDRERVASATAAADRRWQVEYRIVRPDGTVRWVEESAKFIEADGTTPGYLIGSASDVTDRHQLQAAAAERAAVLDGLLATQVAGILVLDGDDRILQASANFAELVGMRPHRWWAHRCRSCSKPTRPRSCRGSTARATRSMCVGSWRPTELPGR
ncbi:PAS domain-containing protein [Rhodococcus opacus]|nr:PAS domain-containing protein [Rhodococcus opacus]